MNMHVAVYIFMGSVPAFQNAALITSAVVSEAKRPAQHFYTNAPL